MGRSSRPGPVRSLPIRRSVDGSSQRGKVCARPDPAGPGVVGRGAGEQWPGGRWGPTRFPGCQRLGGPSALSADLLAEGGKTPRKGVEKAVFSKSTTWIISAQLLYQNRVKPRVAST